MHACVQTHSEALWIQCGTLTTISKDSCVVTMLLRLTRSSPTPNSFRPDHFAPTQSASKPVSHGRRAMAGGKKENRTKVTNWWPDSASSSFKCDQTTLAESDEWKQTFLTFFFITTAWEIYFILHNRESKNCWIRFACLMYVRMALNFSLSLTRTFSLSHALSLFPPLSLCAYLFFVWVRRRISTPRENTKM